jgi:hypothetical protein
MQAKPSGLTTGLPWPSVARTRAHGKVLGSSARAAIERRSSDRAGGEHECVDQRELARPQLEQLDRELFSLAHGTAQLIHWELGPLEQPCLVVHGRERCAA